jgi:4-hydroxy-3-polyprenylbenzoate decarboxylase
VVDGRGKRYGIPVLVGAHASSRDIYAIGMMCKPQEIVDKWEQARANPIKPKLVDNGPVQEEVHTGDQLMEHGGMDEFPVPITTPGFDNAPYLTAGNWVTKDPETGIANVGNYRGMIKSNTRIGCCAGNPTQHFLLHWHKCKAKGIPLQAACVIGPPPSVGYCSVIPLPYGVDEHTVAGGIGGEPLELVRCKTVDIEVPATAEIVIEGEMPTDSMEREAPFGEFPGYMGLPMTNPYFNIKCITHRKNPIFNTFISQFPPSEASKIRGVAIESNYYLFLKHDCNLPGVVDVAVHETSGAWHYIVIVVNKTHPGEAWQALYGLAGHNSSVGKIMIAVDDDIDPRDPDSVNWTLCFRMQPHNDTRVLPGRVGTLDPSTAPATASEAERQYPSPSGASMLLMEATKKWDYFPISLPKQEFMERAREIWEREGLPKLKPKKPWFGTQTALWTEEFEEESRLALLGRYHETGDKLAKQRIKM